MTKTSELMSVFITRAAKYFNKSRLFFDHLDSLHRYYQNKGRYSSEDYHDCSRVSLKNKEIKLWYYDDSEWIPYLQGYDEWYFDTIGYYLPLFVALKGKKLNLLVLDYYKLCRRANSSYKDISYFVQNLERLRDNRHEGYTQQTKQLADWDWIFNTTNDEFLKEIESRYNL